MSVPYYADESVTLWHGQALDVLRSLSAGSVDCAVTSPPYFGLRDYGVAGQIGAEPSPAEYVEALRLVFAEVRRVLAADGTCWLNLGDSYYSGRGNPGPNSADPKQGARRFGARSLDRPGQAWSKPKNLLGIPWRVAFALQDDGWILRNDIIWNKPNAMPESVTDRLSTRHEHLFLLSKSPRYWFDLDSIREDHAEKSLYQQQVARRRPHAAGKSGTSVVPGQAAQSGMKNGSRELNIRGANPGDVWSIPTKPFAEAHFACMPVTLAERCVQAGCKPGGTVLDPFSGSSTTGLAAARHGRRYVGVDLNADYLALSLRTRLAQGAMLDGGAA